MIEYHAHHRDRANAVNLCSICHDLLETASSHRVTEVSLAGKYLNPGVKKTKSATDTFI